MNRIRPVALVALLALAALAPQGTAETASADFSIEYRINDATGEVSYSVLGTYGAAIRCGTTWERRDAKPLEPKLNLLEIREPWIRYASDAQSDSAYASSEASTANRIIRYNVLPGQGRLEILQTVNGTLTNHTEYKCSTYRLDTTPATNPPTGWQNATLVAKADQPPCRTESREEGTYLEPRDNNPRGKSFGIQAADAGLCVTLGYAGVIPPEDPDCGVRCIPFSGVVRGGATYVDPNTGETKVRVDGTTCSFLVVGGYCWRAASDNTSDGVSRPATVWNPCDCQATLKGVGYVSTLGGDAPAAGSWGIAVYGVQ